MEFWKRKKSTPGGNSSINPATISGPIHNLEPSIAFTNDPPVSPINQSFSGGPSAPSADFNSNNMSSAEFQNLYKQYRQRRLSNNSARNSQLSTDQISPSGTPTEMQGMSRQRSNGSEYAPPMSSQASVHSANRAPSVISNASSAGEYAESVPGTTPRGSLRSARSAAQQSRSQTGASSGGMTTGDPRDPAYSARSGSYNSRTVPRGFDERSQVASTTPSFYSASSSVSAASGTRRSGMSVAGVGGFGGIQQQQQQLDEESLTEEEINLMLGRLMDEMDLKDAQRMQMQKLSTQNKLKLIKQNRQLETFQLDSKSNAPEYFYRYLKETDIRSLPKQMLLHLRICVTTQPVAWVKQFVEIQGLEALSECLGILNHSRTRKGDDITKEMEIIRCIKSVVNIQWGAQDVLRFPSCVHNLCFSIDAPSLLTRRLISEILTYICYLNVPTGHAAVLKGLDKLQKFREMQKRFEPWMRALETAIDGRGRMGSKVGVSDELRQMGGTADRDLTDYVLSSMIFVNAVVGVSDDVEMRNHYRNQLNAAGLSRIMKKLRQGFDSPLIALQLNKFEKDSEQDHADVLELYNQQIMQDMTDPEEVFQAILAQIDDDENAREHFLSILQRLLLLRDDFIADSASVAESTSGRPTKAKYYQLLDEITTQVVMDIRTSDQIGSDYASDEDRPLARNTDSFTNQYGVSVAGIIDKFSNEEQLEEAVREAKDLREQLEKVTRQKNELELEVSLKSEGLVGTLKTKIFALEDLLRMSRHTIEALQTQIKELRDQFTQKLAKQDSQLKQLYAALQDEAGEHDMLRQLKNDLTIENEVLRSGVALQVSEDNPDHVVLNHDRLLAEIEKLKQQRPDLNRMTKARQMLEELLSEAGQGLTAKPAGAKPTAATSAAANVSKSTAAPAAAGATSPQPQAANLPEGTRVGTVTMQSLSTTTGRLPEFAKELQDKLGKRQGNIAVAKETIDDGGDSETQSAGAIADGITADDTAPAGPAPASPTLTGPALADPALAGSAPAGSTPGGGDMAQGSDSNAAPAADSAVPAAAVTGPSAPTGTAPPPPAPPPPPM
ncbi:hypothetical protein EC988_003300, partial [Linderina pennispora]